VVAARLGVGNVDSSIQIRPNDMLQSHKTLKIMKLMKLIRRQTVEARDSASSIPSIGSLLENTLSQVSGLPLGQNEVYYRW